MPKRDSRYYEMKFNSLLDHEGRRIGAYQFVHDVTKRLADQDRLAQAESALRQSQKMEAVGQLTGGVAHDFNNLLMAFSSGMFLLDQPMDADRRRRILDSMRQAIDRGTALTRQLLAFSRRRPLATKTVDLRVQLLGMQEMLQRSLRGDMEVKMSFNDEQWPVDVDPGELELAILNICVNSRDAMPDGGTISISTRNSVDTVTSRSRTRAWACPRTCWRAHSSRSSRPRRSERDPAWDSRRSTDSSRSPMARSRLKVRPARARPCPCQFPRSEKPVADAEANNHGLASHSGNRAERRSRTRAKVLLVEDDLTVAGLTLQMLESIGLSVVHVKSAAAALDALAEARDIDIVFSDVMMPGGMSGVELAREIRKRSPDLPIVLTTGYIEVARSAVTEGLEVLVKPYPLEVLSRTLMAHLSQRAAAVR